jgi:opacity protein-like surface antigen
MVGVRVGSLGLGLEAGVDLMEQFSFRLGLNKFQFEQSMTVAYINYDLDMEWNTINLLADWHPFKGPLRLTGGFFKNNNRIHGGTSSPTLIIGGTRYDGAKLSVDVEFEPISPYLGIGWEHGLFDKKGLSVNFDLGVLFQGSGDVDLKVGGIAKDAVSEEDLAYEERQFEAEIEDYKYYPVFALGISYQF